LLYRLSYRPRCTAGSQFVLPHPIGDLKSKEIVYFERMVNLTLVKVGFKPEITL